MSAKHTPGPWCVGGVDSDEVHCRIFSQDIGCNVHVKLVDAPSVGGLIPDEQLKANARLIAAAPVLLAFAQEWLERQGTDENYMTAKARAAIAKAIG